MRLRSRGSCGRAAGGARSAAGGEGRGAGGGAGRGAPPAGPRAARGVRRPGQPHAVDDALAALAKAKEISAGRMITGFSWVDVDRWSTASSIQHVLARLKGAGLDA